MPTVISWSKSQGLSFISRCDSMSEGRVALAERISLGFASGGVVVDTTSLKRPSCRVIYADGHRIGDGFGDGMKEVAALAVTP